MIKHYDESVEKNYIPLMNLIKHHSPNIGKIYLYVKDPLESYYQLLINRREKVGTEELKNPKAFIDYSQTTDDVYENLEDYNNNVDNTV